MSFAPGFKSRILVGDFGLSAYTNDVTAHWEQDMLESTVFTTAPAKSFICGTDTGTFDVGGLYDAAQHTDSAAWKSGGAQALTYSPNGNTLGSEAWLVNALETEFTSSAAVNGIVEFSLGAQVDGIVDMGVSLHDLSAETADGDGAAYDQTVVSTTAGGVGHLHVTAFSGLTNIIVTIADSATGSSGWATIGTFATATGVTSERLVIAGTVRRYVRASWDVTGTGSATFATSFARR